jgi:hypothetical protein
MWVFALALSATALLAQVPAGMPRAPGARVVTLTAPGISSEPSVAISPNDPRQVVVAYQVPASIAYSTDFGVHWDHAKGVAPQHFKVSGDPSVTFDNKGHAIFSYIAFNKLGTFNYWGHATETNGVFVRRSLDGGKTWQHPEIVVSEQKVKPGVHIPMEDKPYIVADVSHGPYAGNLYIGWTRWSLKDSRMVLSRSTDDGKTWSSPVEIDRQRGCPETTTAPLRDSMARLAPTVRSMPCGLMTITSSSPPLAMAGSLSARRERFSALRRVCLPFRILSAPMDSLRLPSIRAAATGGTRACM